MTERPFEYDEKLLESCALSPLATTFVISVNSISQEDDGKEQQQRIAKPCHNSNNNAEFDSNNGISNNDKNNDLLYPCNDIDFEADISCMILLDLHAKHYGRPCCGDIHSSYERMIFLNDDNANITKTKTTDTTTTTTTTIVPIQSKLLQDDKNNTATANTTTSDNHNDPRNAGNGDNYYYYYRVGDRLGRFLQSLKFVYEHNSKLSSSELITHRVTLNRFSDTNPQTTIFIQNNDDNEQQIFNDDADYDDNDNHIDDNDRVDDLEDEEEEDLFHTLTTRFFRGNNNNNDNNDNNNDRLLFTFLNETKLIHQVGEKLGSMHHLKDNYSTQSNDNTNTNSGNNATKQRRMAETISILRIGADDDGFDNDNNLRYYFQVPELNEPEQDGTIVRVKPYHHQQEPTRTRTRWDKKKKGGDDKEEKLEDEFKFHLNWATELNPDGVPIVHDVFDQGYCGSCWAYVATGSLEASTSRRQAYEAYNDYLSAVLSSPSLKSSSSTSTLKTSPSYPSPNNSNDTKYLVIKVDDNNITTTTTTNDIRNSNDNETDVENHNTYEYDITNYYWNAITFAQYVEKEVFKLTNLSIQELIDCDNEGCSSSNDNNPYGRSTKHRRNYHNHHHFYKKQRQLSKKKKKKKRNQNNRYTTKRQQQHQWQQQCNQGCIGGNPLLAFDFIHKYGLTTWNNYPYVGYEQDTCQSRENDNVDTNNDIFHVDENNDDPTFNSATTTTASSSSIAKVQSWGVLSKNYENDIEIALRYIGPVAVGINANNNEFLYYESGIFNLENCDQNANHALLIVGYGEELKKIKNTKKNKKNDKNKKINHSKHKYRKEGATRKDNEDYSLKDDDFYYDHDDDDFYSYANDNNNFDNTHEIIRYWIARNSWGKGWGENGYVRIQRGDGLKGTLGVCGIARTPSVALGGMFLPDRTKTIYPFYNNVNDSWWNNYYNNCFLNSNSSSNSSNSTNIGYKNCNLNSIITRGQQDLEQQEKQQLYNGHNIILSMERVVSYLKEFYLNHEAFNLGIVGIILALILVVWPLTMNCRRQRRRRRLRRIQRQQLQQKQDQQQKSEKLGEKDGEEEDHPQLPGATDREEETETEEKKDDKEKYGIEQTNNSYNSIDNNNNNNNRINNNDREEPTETSSLLWSGPN